MIDELETGGRVSRECHKCRYFGRTDDAARNACVSCEGPAERSDKGVNYVYLDDMPAPAELIEAERVDRHDHDEKPDDTRTIFEAEVEDALREVLAKYMALDPIDRFIFDCVFHGKDIPNTAAEIVRLGERLRGMTKQAVDHRFLQMERKNPELHAVLRGMIREGAGGAAKKGTRVNQGYFNFAFD